MRIFLRNEVKAVREYQQCEVVCMGKFVSEMRAVLFDRDAVFLILTHLHSHAFVTCDIAPTAGALKESVLSPVCLTVVKEEKHILSIEKTVMYRLVEVSTFKGVHVQS